MGGASDETVKRAKEYLRLRVKGIPIALSYRGVPISKFDREELEMIIEYQRQQLVKYGALGEDVMLSLS